MAVQVFKDGQSEWIPNEELDRFLGLGYSVNDPDNPPQRLEIQYPAHIKPEEVSLEEAEKLVLDEMGLRPPIEIIHPEPS